MFKSLMKKSKPSFRQTAAAFREIGDEIIIKIDGVDLAVWEVQGTGKPLVFVHGNSACKEVFHNQVNAFAAAGHHVISLDLPGHGSSADASDPNTQYTIPGYALIIKRLIDKMGVVSPVVVGWSLGGHIAIEMVGRGFDVAGALIVGTPPLGPGVADFERALLPSPFAAVTTSEDAPDDQVRLYTQNLYGVLDPIPDLFIEAGLRTDGKARRIMGEHWGGGEDGCHQKTVAAGSEIPFCVLHGMDDPFISHDFLCEAQWRTLWADKIHEMPGIGHAAFAEAPADFNRILKEFLAGGVS